MAARDWAGAPAGMGDYDPDAQGACRDSPHELSPAIRMKQRARLVLVVVTLLMPLATGRLAAQKLEKQDSHSLFETVALARAAGFFRKPELAELRTGMGVDQVPDSATVEIIREADLRKSLAAAALASLHRVYRISSKEEAKALFASYDVYCFRIGKYYTALLVTSDEAQRKHPLVVNGSEPLLVFTAVKDGEREKHAMKEDVTFQYVTYTSM